MDTIPFSALIGVFCLLLCMSAFFSGSETALMSLNRYRLRHLTKQGHAGARRASRLLDQPDRLIGLILIGNNFVNILITQLATYIGFRAFGSGGIALSTGILTLILLIFAEVAPKTLGALHSERFAFPAAFIYLPLLKITYPLVWLINLFANGLLKLLGVPTDQRQSQALSYEEMSSVVNEASGIDSSHREMLLRILDLEKITIQDVMVPRADILGIDLEEPFEEIEAQLRQQSYTRMPVYRGNINNVVGYIHMRRLLSLLANDALTKAEIETQMQPAYFVPETTTLTRQLHNFKQERRRHALVVDEYGDIAGMVTMEDLLEEIVGEFTHDSNVSDDIHLQSNGSWFVDGGAQIREINRLLELKLPTDGPKTLNGLIIDRLQAIPEAQQCVMIDGYPIEVIKISQNAIKTARISPNTDSPSKTPADDV